MQHIYITYNDDETGDNFSLNKDYESHFIPDSINIMIDVLKLMKFSDNLIEKWLGYTYFELDNPPVDDDDYDCCCGRCD